MDWLSVGLVTGMFLAPFGTIWLINKIKEVFLVKKGYVKAYFRLPNDRKVFTFLKPEKDIIRYGGNAYPYNNSVGYIFYEGNVPCVEYDVGGNQVNFKTEEKSMIDSKDLDTVLERVYNLGKLRMNKSNKYFDIIMMSAIAAAGLAALNAALLWNLMAHLPA